MAVRAPEHHGPSLSLPSLSEFLFRRDPIDRDLDRMRDLVLRTSDFEALRDKSQMFGMKSTSLAHVLPVDRVIGALKRVGVKEDSPLVDWVSNLSVRFFNHNRHEHSLHVFDITRAWGKEMELDPYRLKVACAVAILHDIGHRAWAHPCERVLRARGVPFDHDVFTCILASQPEYRGIYRELGLDPKDVVAALAAEGILDKRDTYRKMSAVLKEHGLPHSMLIELDETTSDFSEVTKPLLRKWEPISHWVQHYCDFFAYVEYDWLRSPEAEERLPKVREVRNRAMGAIEFGEDGRLVLKDPAVVDKVVLALLNKEIQMPLSVWPAWATKLLFIGLQESRISDKEILEGTETPLEKRLPGHIRMKLKLGVDRFYDECCRVVSKGKTIEELRIKPQDVERALNERLGALMASGRIDSSLEVFATETAPYNRFFPFGVRESEIGTVPVGTEVKLSGRKPHYANDPVELYRTYPTEDRVDYEFRQTSYQISVPVRNFANGVDIAQIRAAVQEVLEELGIRDQYAIVDGQPSPLKGGNTGSRRGVSSEPARSASFH